MNPENERPLADLLGEALSSVAITRGGSGRLDPRDYRRMVQRYRATYDVEIGDATVKERTLSLMRAELAQFLREDKTHSATYAIFGGPVSGSSIEYVLKNLLEAAIVNGPIAAARAFYGEIASGYLPYQQYFLLSGLTVEHEVQVGDGLSLIPLPNSTQYLPGFLPDRFRVDSTDFLSKTLLRVDMSVSPVLHKPEQGYTIQSGPETHFNISIRSTDLADFNPGKFFLALTLVGDHPVFSKITWMHLSDEHIFDLRRGSGSGYSQDARSASSAVFSEAQVHQAIELYRKITGLPRDVEGYLEIPIDRWIKSKTHQGYVDRMIDLGIAFESFYLRGIRNELSFRFRLRASLYLEDGVDQRALLKRRFGQIYEIRSQAVHEGTVPQQVGIEGHDVRMMDFYERSQELFKRSLLKVIEKGRVPNWGSIELRGGDEPDDDSG